MEGLVRRYTSYTKQFKLNILQFMNDKGTSLLETAAIFNISTPSTIIQWRKSFEELGGDALESKKKGRPSVKNENERPNKKQTPTEGGSIETLQAEIERLRMENAYLKKLNALVQNKETSPNKTKQK